MRVLFTETQGFLRPWMRGLAVIVAVLAVGFVSLQVSEGMWATVMGSVVLLGVLALFWTARLASVVREDGLFVRFLPFHRTFRPVPLTDVIDVQARTYSPIRDYGGWGIRCGRDGGRAYNVSGNEGVLLTYRDGTSLLIGTQKPRELEAAIRAVWQRSRD